MPGTGLVSSQTGKIGMLFWKEIKNLRQSIFNGHIYEVEFLSPRMISVFVSAFWVI